MLARMPGFRQRGGVASTRGDRAPIHPHFVPSMTLLESLAD